MIQHDQKQNQDTQKQIQNHHKESKNAQRHFKTTTKLPEYTQNDLKETNPPQRDKQRLQIDVE